MKLDSGYLIKQMEEEEFFKLQRPLLESVFSSDHSIFPHEYLSEKEKKDIHDLRSNLYKDQFKLYVGVFDSNENLVGWHYGYQENAHVFYMCNSAILEEHRRKGLYSSVLKYTTDHLKEKGFQVVYSRHCMTNNAVIIPKLKAGFVITNFELDDVFGAMIHLKLFSNPLRNKILDYRAGQIKPDDELKKIFKF